jgi:hypothetical protein
MAVTRIKNNQIFDSTVVAFAKVQAGSITGNLFAPTVTINSNITITGNLDVYGNTSTINSINTYINDPIVEFNHGYTGSIAGYNMGMLINRNLQSLGPYGAVNTAWVWDENDQAFSAITTGTTGNALVSLTNSGFANIIVGNIRANSFAMSSGTFTAPFGIQDTPIGNVTPNLANFTTLYAFNQSTPNIVITGGSINNTVIGNTTAVSARFSNVTVDTGFYTANVNIQGGYINNLANVSADIAWITTGNFTNANVTNLSGTTGNLLTLTVRNFSTANANIMGSQTYIGGTVNEGEIIANVYSKLGFFNNFTAANAIILGTTSYVGTGAEPVANAYVVTANITNFGTGNAFVGGTQTYIGTGSTPIANAYVGTMFVTTAGGFSTANARITGGYADDFQIGANVPATGTFGNLTTTSIATVTVQNQENSSQSVMTGALRVAGGASISKDLFVLGNVYTSNLISTSTTTLNVQVPLLSLTSNAVFPYNYDIGFYSEFVGGSANVYQTSGFIRNEADNFWYLFSGAPEPIGAVIPLTDPGVILDTLRLGEMVVSNTTQSTDTLTGAVRVAGGLGVDKDINAFRISSTFGNVITGFVQNFSAANANIQGTTTFIGSGDAPIANAYGVLGQFLQFSTANAIITGGAINGTVIGNNTPVVATVTNLYATQVAYLAGNIVANAESTSTNTTTGALVVTGAGGVGVGGNLNVGGVGKIAGNVVMTIDTDTTASNIGALVLTNGGLSVQGNAYVGANLYVGSTAAFTTDLITPTVTAVDSGSRYAQMAILNSATTGSATYRAYADNYTGSALDQGWAGIGFTGAGFNDPEFTLTKANDAFVFASAVEGAGNGGNLVLSTNWTGTYNDIVIGVGSFFANAEVARFTGNISDNGNLTIKYATPSTSANTGALVVEGGVGFKSNLQIFNGANVNLSKTIGEDFRVSGQFDDTLIWAHADSLYDAVWIGGDAYPATLNPGVKFGINSTDAMQLPVGSNAGRPSSVGGTDVQGLFRFNTVIDSIEWYTNSGWQTAGTVFTIVSDFQYDGDGVTTDFTMAGQSTTTAATIVSVNGVIQIPSLAYAVTTGNTIVFTEPPAVGDVVDARTLVTTQTVTAIASTNGYMSFFADNDGAKVSTGTEKQTVTAYWEPRGAQVANIGNVTVTTANTVITVDSYDVDLYRTAKYVVQITRGGDYQTSEVLVTHDTSDAKAVTYGTVVTNGNLGVCDANVYLGNVKLNFIAALSNTTVRIKKDYLPI